MFGTLFWEKWQPLVIGICVSLLAYKLNGYGFDFKKDSAFFSSIITLGGIFSAFSVTIKSIILNNDEKMTSIKRSGYQNLFLRYLSRSIDSSLLLCVVGFLGFIQPLANVSFASAVVAGLFVYCLLALRRITRISTAVLKQGKRPNAG